MKRKLLLLGTARPGKSGGRGVGLHSRTVHQYSKSALVMPSSLSHEYPPLYVCTTPYSKMSKMISYHHDTTKKLDLDFLLNYKILLYFTFQYLKYLYTYFSRLTVLDVSPKCIMHDVFSLSLSWWWHVWRWCSSSATRSCCCSLLN